MSINYYKSPYNIIDKKKIEEEIDNFLEFFKNKKILKKYLSFTNINSETYTFSKTGNYYLFHKFSVKFNFLKDDIIEIFFKCPFKYIDKLQNGNISLNLFISNPFSDFKLNFFNIINTTKNFGTLFNNDYSFTLDQNLHFLNFDFYLYKESEDTSISIDINKRLSDNLNLPKIEFYLYRKF